MYEAVSPILTRAARRLLRTRALEAAAVLGAASGFAASALMLAWIVAPSHRLAAIAICTAPLVAGAILLALPAVPAAMHLSTRTARLTAALWAVLATGAAALVISGRYEQIGRQTFAAIALVLGAAAGAAAVLVRGVSIRRAAVYLDERADLSERAATAVELAESPDREKPSSMAVFAQASAALRDLRAQELSMWRRTRATPAALALSVMLCATLALIPAGRGERVGAAAAALERLSHAERRELSRAFEKASRRSGDSPIADELARAATAIEVADADALAEAIEALRKAGFEMARVDAKGLLSGVGAGDSRTGAQAGRDGPSAATAPIAGVPDGHDLPGVRVWDPKYAEVLPDGAPPSAMGAPAGAGGFLTFDAAWSAARERAARAADEGTIPPRYRQLVRDFFATQE